MRDYGAKGLLLRVLGNRRRIGGVDRWVLEQVVEPVELKHIPEECAYGVLKTRRGEQAVHLSRQPLLHVKIALSGGAQKLGIRGRVSQEIAEAGRLGPAVEAHGPRLLRVRFSP